HNLQPRYMAIPGGEILAVLGGDAGRGAVRPAKDDGAAHLSTGHVESLGCGIDNLVDRLHGEVESHELDDRSKAGKGRAYAEAGEAMLGDRRVYHPGVAELGQQPLRDLVGALVLCNLLAHDEDAR